MWLVQDYPTCKQSYEFRAPVKQGHPKSEKHRFNELFQKLAVKKIVLRAPKDLNLVLSMTNIRVAQMVPG